MIAEYAKLLLGDFMKRKLEGMFALLLGTVIWGGAFVAQSAGMDLIGPMTFQAVRCALAVLALLLLSALLEIRQINQYFIKWADPRLWITGLFCGLALFAATALQQIALIYTDAGKAGFLTAMYIVIVPLLGIFFRRRPSTNALIGVSIAVIGMYLLCCAGVSRAVAGLYFLSCMGVTTVSMGDLLLLGCAVAFAVQITIVDRFAAQLDTLRLNCIQALVVTLISSVFMAFEKPTLHTIIDCWLPLSYAGILSMGFGYSLQIFGQKRLEPTGASMIMSLESVFAVVFGALILKERMSIFESIGCILVFLAVILSQLPNKKKRSVK